MSDSYEVGTRAWQPDSTEGWVPSEVEEKLVEGDKVRLVFRLGDGEVRANCLMVSSCHVTSAFIIERRAWQATAFPSRPLKSSDLGRPF